MKKLTEKCGLGSIWFYQIYSVFGVSFKNKPNPSSDTLVMNLKFWLIAMSWDYIETLHSLGFEVPLLIEVVWLILESSSLETTF